MNYAIIENGIVKNIIVADPDQLHNMAKKIQDELAEDIDFTNA